MADVGVHQPRQRRRAVGSTYFYGFFYIFINVNYDFMNGKKIMHRAAGDTPTQTEARTISTISTDANERDASVWASKIRRPVEDASKLHLVAYLLLTRPR
jgi:hypothetical protein